MGLPGIRQVWGQQATKQVKRHSACTRTCPNLNSCPPRTGPHTSHPSLPRPTRPSVCLGAKLLSSWTPLSFTHSLKCIQNLTASHHGPGPAAPTASHLAYGVIPSGASTLASALQASTGGRLFRHKRPSPPRRARCSCTSRRVKSKFSRGHHSPAGAEAALLGPWAPDISHFLLSLTLVPQPSGSFFPSSSCCRLKHDDSLFQHPLGSRLCVIINRGRVSLHPHSNPASTMQANVC